MAWKTSAVHTCIATCVTAVLVLAVAPAPAMAQLNPPLRLSIDNRFPLVGGQMTFTLTGPQGTAYNLVSSRTPVEIRSQVWGIIRVDPADLKIRAQGTLPQSGEATIVLPLSDNPGLAGTPLHFQAAGALAGSKGTSNGITTRLSTQPPSGTRNPEAIVVTPNGRKAYVAHEEDGTISVIDALSDLKVDDIPYAPIPAEVGLLPLRLVIDTQGRHLFVVDPRQRQVTVFDTVTDSTAGLIPVPAGCRDLAYDISAGGDKRVYITNERDNSVLVLRESPNGTFTQIGTLALQGRGPGAIAVTGDHKLVVAHRSSHEVEIVNPVLPGGVTIGRIPIGRIPWDIVVTGSRAYVPTFDLSRAPETGDGDNVVMELDLVSQTIVDADHLRNHGTDYFAAVKAKDFLGVAAAGSGVLLIADLATAALIDRVDLAPGEGTTHPLDMAFIPSQTGDGPHKAYAIDYFRETVRPVDLLGGPPFAVLPEIPLAWSGQPRLPMIDLTPVEDGEWFYSTVEFFNGTATNPNRVTCNTCHPFTTGSGLRHPDVDGARQAQSMWNTGDTGPWLWRGGQPNLRTKTQGLFVSHGTVGGSLQPEAEDGMLDFQIEGTRRVPKSPFLLADGSLSPAAARGKVVFEGQAACAACHTSPLFIPVPPNPRTIAAGVGTGLVPANVPTLIGLWASGPYLSHGRAETLMEVLTDNPGDQHGATSTLTSEQLADLVEYLKSL